MRRPDPVEIAHVFIPVLIEAVVVTLTICAAVLCVAIYATRVPV